MVDNGSTDNSKDIFAEELLKPENDFARLVIVEKNRGYGFGIMQGVFAAKADIIAWTHADMQTDPQDVVNLYDKYGKELNDGKAYAKEEESVEIFLILSLPGECPKSLHWRLVWN